MPTKQSEEKTILGHIAYWIKFLATTGVGVLITWSLNRQTKQTEKQETIQENQAKFNSDVSRALDKNTDAIQYLREDIKENREKLKELDEKTEDLERYNRKHE